MCLLVILFSKLRINYFKEMEKPIPLTLVWYWVKTPYVSNGAAQHILHGDTFPLNDNSILLYKFTIFSKLEITFPEIFLSASFVPV